MDPFIARSRGCRRRSVVLTVSSVVLASLAALSVAAGAGIIGPWLGAVTIPGLAALNVGVGGDFNSVSCPSTGNCVAAGGYHDTATTYQAFVASEVNGTWKPATQVPGTATLNVGGGASADSVACSSTGNCSLGGTYTDLQGNSQIFVATEVNGAWKPAIQVSSGPTIGRGPYAWFDTLSCTSAGNCGGGGYYTGSANTQQAFVISATNGTWGAATQVPGTATLNAGGKAETYVASCTSSGNCMAGGYYATGPSQFQAFVVNESRGTWQTAAQMPSVASLNVGQDAGLFALSCTSIGNCDGGGRFRDSGGHNQAYVISEVKGTWHLAQELPGSAALNVGGVAGVETMSCPKSGSCSLGGYYTEVVGSGYQSLVASQVNGTWQPAIDVPGSEALNAQSDGHVNAISCAGVGNCSAGGTYKDANGHSQAFVVNEEDGTWQSAVEIPGSEALNVGGNAGVNAVSCAPSGYCAAGGYYHVTSSQSQDFVATTKAPPVLTRTVTCVRGKVVRHVTAVAPRCPVGYTLKK